MTRGWLRTLPLMLVLLLFMSDRCLAAQQLDARFADYSIDRLVRFADSAGAEQRRQQMIEFIWPDGLPDALPSVQSADRACPQLAAVDSKLIGTIERWDVDVGGMDFHSDVYVATPRDSKSSVAGLAIVCAGHMPEGPENYLSSGLSETINALLEKGFVVAVMQMPLAGWNRDVDGSLVDGGARFEVASRLTGGHNELFDEVESELGGQTMRFFLEPVVQVNNLFQARYSDQQLGLLMIGLSGGGWTTHLAAAVDTRIDLSIPVAGSLPLYARPFSPGSGGDREQYYQPLYREVDSDGDGVLDTADGVCSWLEIYALGGISANEARPREQIQVLNFYDSCCFGGPIYETYAEQLSQQTAQLPGSAWRVYSDRSHRDHLISQEVIDQVLLPAIEQHPRFARMILKPTERQHK